MSEPRIPPTSKPFRDEAKTESVKCIACGGPITLHGFGAIEQITCPSCGSVLAAEPGSPLAVLQAARREHRRSALALHQRGTFEGKPWEVIGIVWRFCRVDGTEYPWQEFLLFNPYHGYRWLVFSMHDGHWQYGRMLDGAARAKQGSFSHRAVTFDGRAYRHFQTVTAIVSYVEGEFPWQVRVDDHVVAHEYIAPPRSISIEEAQGSDGQEVTFTELGHLTPKEVAAAFRLQHALPSTSGVASTQANPWKRHSLFLWSTCAVFFLLWLVATVIYVAGRDEQTRLKYIDLPFAAHSQTVELGEPGTKTTVELTFAPMPLENTWAYLDVMLVPVGSEQALGFGIEADAWSGVADGEAWSEGDPTPSVVLGGIEGGTYLLQLQPQAGVAEAGAVVPTQMGIEIRTDVPLIRYAALSLLAIFAVPLFNTLLSLTFEGRRWSNSDYSDS